MTLNQTTDSQLKELMLEVIKKQKPENTKQLINLMQERHGILPEKTNNLLIELENEDRVHFTKEESSTYSSAKTYVLSKKTLWYWATVVLVVATTITIFAIPDSDYPLVYLRIALGILFVFFFPGYAFVRFIFPAKLPKSFAGLTRVQIETTSENTNNVEHVALSVGLSLAFVSIVGLILNYTPEGITLTSTTLLLLSLTVVFATAAIARAYKIKQ